MAVGVTTNTQITKARKLFVTAAIFTQEFKHLMANSVDVKQLPQGMGTTWNEPYWPTLTAASLTEGVAIASPQQVSDASIVITPAEVGGQIIFTRRMANMISENFSTVAGKLLGNAIARKKDQDLIGSVQGASATAIGSSTTTASWDLVGRGVSRIESGRIGTARTGALSEGDPAPRPYFFLGHPYHRFDFASQFNGLGGAPTQVTTAAAAANYFGQSLSEQQFAVIRGHFTFNDLAGATVLFDGNLTPSSNAVTGAVYAKESTVLVPFRQLDVDQEWNPSRRAWEWTATEDYGFGTRADPWIQKVALDASAP